MKTDLGSYNNSWYKPGNFFVRSLWYVFNVVFFLNPFSTNGLKKIILKLFGAKIGRGVVVKPRVNIKYPWKLIIGNNVWIGEDVWIDNLGNVKIGDNCCLSQGAMILSGNHNYKKTTFDLMVEDIVLEDGVWIGAKSVVCQGINCRSHAVLTVQSVATSNLDSYGIYQGNPAVKVKVREIV